MSQQSATPPDTMAGRLPGDYVPEPIEAVEDTIDLISEVHQPIMRKCKVHHMDMDPENTGIPITVCVNDPSKRKIFDPGSEVELSEVEISALRDAVTESQIVIPQNSGIYEARDQMAEARRQYPSMSVQRDKLSGMLVAIKRVPRFVIEVLD